jgi:formylglycine-generating enzyme required for sulfatase activity
LGSKPTGELAPNENGFHDLLGNVAEWLEAGDAPDGVAMVGGGSWLDDLESLRRVPTQELPRGDRARHVGFRVLVVQEIGSR